MTLFILKLRKSFHVSSILFTLGLFSLFFLPVIESFSRQWGLALLLFGSLLIAIPTLWYKRVRFDVIDVLWLVFLIVCTLSFITSWSYAKSYTELLRYISYFLIFLSVRNYPKTERLLKVFFVPFVLINSIILSVLSVVYSLPFIEPPLTLNGMNLFYSFMGHNRIASLLIFSIPATVVLFNNAKNNKFKIIWLTLLTFFILVIVLSLARGSMISLAFAFFLYLSLRGYDHHVNGEKSIISITLILSAIALIMLSFIFIYSNFLVQQKNMEVSQPVFFRSAKNEHRLDYFNQAVDGFIQHPILGTGLDTFSYVSLQYRKGTSDDFSLYTHNHYLQLLVEIGGIGGLIFMCLILSILKNVRRTIQHGNAPSFYSAVSISLFASAFNSLIDFDWQFLSVFLLFWIGCALLLASNSRVHLNKQKCTSVFQVLTIVVCIMFFVKFLLPLDTDQILNNLSDMSIQDTAMNSTLPLLQKLGRLDQSNPDIAQKLAEIYSQENLWQEAHDWYQKSITYDPMNSQNVIKKDYLVYMTQAQKSADRKDVQTAFSLLYQSRMRYPLISDIFHGDNYLYNISVLLSQKEQEKVRKIVYEYISIAQKTIRAKSFTSQELYFIVSYLSNILKQKSS